MRDTRELRHQKPAFAFHDRVLQRDHHAVQANRGRHQRTPRSVLHDRASATLYRFKTRRMPADLGIDEAGYAAG
jgi:hypothetical protein